MTPKSVWYGVGVGVALAGLLTPVQGSATPKVAGHSTSTASYVVVLKPGAVAAAAAAEATRRYGLTVDAVYSHALEGYSAEVPAGQLAALRADPTVALVEPNQSVRQPSGAPTLSGALTAQQPDADAPQGCLQQNTERPNLLRLHLCLHGLSMLRISGVQPGAQTPPVSSEASPTVQPQSSPRCQRSRGDTRCEAWVSRFNYAKTSVGEFAAGMAVSPAGDHIFVGGTSFDVPRDQQTMAIIAYDAQTGQQNWATLPFVGAGGGCNNCAVLDIAVSPNGSQVYVTGYTQNSGTYGDVRTLALDAHTGAIVWDNRYDRAGSTGLISAEAGVSIAASPDGSLVYVSGYSGDIDSYHGILIAYDSLTGHRLWRSVGPRRSIFQEVRVGGSRVYTTGAALNQAGNHIGISTAAYVGRTGSELWRSQYNGPSGANGNGDYVHDMVVAPAGDRVYLTGFTTTGPNYDYSWLTAAYAADTGQQQWTRRLVDQPGLNEAESITVSPAGDRVYVVGYTKGRDGRRKPTMVSYNSTTGGRLWTQTYAPNGTGIGGYFTGAAVSPDGARLYVNGWYANAAASDRNSTWGYDSLMLAVDVRNGGDHWIARYNSSSGSYGCLASDFNRSDGIGLSPDGKMVYTTGSFLHFFSSDSNAQDIGTVAYRTAGGIINPSPGPIPPPPASACPQILPSNIDRIDADLSSTRSGDGKGSVSGVNVYEIGGGIARRNPELNVVQHVNFTVGPNQDCGRVGTAEAGTIGARDNSTGVVGVAPGVPLIGVKVVDCSGIGTLSQVLSGIDWVTAHAAKPAVADIGLAFAPSRALDQAVTASADSGVFYAVPAGDFGSDCHQSSPARIGAHPGVMAVAATDETGAEAYFSNFGTCVSIWAPGVFVLTTDLHGGDIFADDTEFATPHVAGTAALYLSQHPRTSPAALKQILQRDGVLTGFTSKDGVTPVLQVSAGNY